MSGIDSDNDSAFINDNLYRYCQDEKITFTRSRPYKKNDQAYVEQKNWTAVRRLIGYWRRGGSYIIVTSGDRFMNACKQDQLPLRG